MNNYAFRRRQMVETQLKPRGIIDPLVLEAFSKVPRHEFVPKEYVSQAYNDCPLPIGKGQTISQPYVVALMTQAANLKKENKVLEIGTGSGYQAAILSLICKEVYSVERIGSLAQEAQKRLHRLGYHNVKVKIKDASGGLTEYAPYEAIIVTAAAPSAPKNLAGQLINGGRLIIPIGDLNFQELYRVTEKEIQGKKVLERESLGGVVFVPLIGEQGWKE